MRYHVVMPIQVAVRLHGELAEFVDRRVGDGEAPNRAAVLLRALEREWRRDVAERDAAILARSGGYGDLDGLASHAARTPLDID